jgi:cell wall assembly regulator SMI1
VSADDVVSAWERIESWLAEHAPLTAATLGPPAGPAELAGAGTALGVTFPPELVASLARHDGSDPASPDRFTLAGYTLSPLAGIVARSRSLTGILADLAGGDTGLDDDTMTGWWWHPEWLPFADHIAADALAIDARPGEGLGQVGVFRHEDHTTFDRPSLASLLHETADVLEAHRPSPAGSPTGPELFGLVPRVVDGRLRWGRRRDAVTVAPRSVLALAAEAAEDDRVAAEAEAARRASLADPAVWIPGYGRFCLTFVEKVEGVDVAEVVRRFGGESVGEAVRPEVTQEEADELEESVRGGYQPVVRVGELGGWVVGVEHRPVGQGQRIEVLRRLSAGTRVVVVNFDGRNIRLRHAEDGDLIVGYDSLDPDHRLGLDPDRHDPALITAHLLPPDPDQHPADVAAAAVGIAATITGLPLPGQLGGLLAGAMGCARVLPLLGDPAAVPFRWPVRVDPGVVSKVAYAREEQLRPALVEQARRRVAATGLDAYPEVVGALEEAAAGPTRAVEADSPLGVVLRTVCAEAQAAFGMLRDREHRHLIGREEVTAWQARAAAARALHLLLAGPPSAAAYEVLGPPDQFEDRDALLAALAAVEPPPDAVERLEEHERAQARRGTTLPVRLRK